MGDLLLGSIELVVDIILLHNGFVQFTAGHLWWAAFWWVLATRPWHRQSQTGE